MCGCGRRINPRKQKNNLLRVSPKSVARGQAAGPTPAQLRALGLKNNKSLQEHNQAQNKRRKIEQIRRNIIQRKLNK